MRSGPGIAVNNLICVYSGRLKPFTIQLRFHLSWEIADAEKAVSLSRKHSGGQVTPEDFINRWKDSGGAELANSQSFLKELCTLLDVPHPDPIETDESHNTYVFEKAVALNNGDGTTSAGPADLYRQGSFILESKQGLEEVLDTLVTVGQARLTGDGKYVI